MVKKHSVPKRLSFNLFLVLVIMVSIGIFAVIELLLQVVFRSLPFAFVFTSLIVTITGVTIIIRMSRLTEGTRTRVSVKINRKIEDVKGHVLHWLKERGFEIKEKREDFVIGVRGHRCFPRIYFELTFKGDRVCLLIGEFYTKGWGMPEINLRSKSFFSGLAGRQGSRLMNEFLEYLRGYESGKV